MDPVAWVACNAGASSVVAGWTTIIAGTAHDLVRSFSRRHCVMDWVFALEPALNHKSWRGGRHRLSCALLQMFVATFQPSPTAGRKRRAPLRSAAVSGSVSFVADRA